MADVADRLVRALGSYDADALRPLLAPSARRWLNLGEVESGVDDLLATIELERSCIESPSLEVRRRFVADDGFVLLMTMTGRTTQGVDVRVPVALAVSVGDDGLIHRMDEYANFGDVRPILQAMSDEGGTN